MAIFSNHNSDNTDFAYLKCDWSGCIIRIAAFFPLSARGRERTGKGRKRWVGYSPLFICSEKGLRRGSAEGTTQAARS